MKSLLTLCLALCSALVALGATSDEIAQLRQLTDDFDTAVASGQLSRLRLLAHDRYTYTEPSATPYSPSANPPSEIPKDTRLADRLKRDKCWSDVSPTVLVVGPTAVVTGTYRVLEPRGTPRLLAQGRFTSTWVQSGDTWLLLAEHRSLNDVLTWAANIPAPTRPTPPLIASNTAPVAASDAPPEKKKATTFDGEDARAHRGLLPKNFSDLFRAYEPTRLGYTWDRGDDPFMDFAFSAMFPLHTSASDYPDPIRLLNETDYFRPTAFSGPQLYFAATIRAGQYIGTRPSSPVVGKRFNPLLAVRFWTEQPGGLRESEDNFLEFSYGHESNGQFIASHARFTEQLRVYLNQANDASTPEAAALARQSAFLSTRDNISRGWDYVGVQYARDWDSRLPLPWLHDRDVTMALHAKFNYYLHRGLAQGEAEEYNPWESDPEGKSRRQVDGLAFRYTVTINPPANPAPAPEWTKLFKFERRYAVTWTTGYAAPFKFNTVKLEASLVLFDKLPLTFWARFGYNSDLIDYYRKDHSLGLSLSYWNF